jgi:hypothetical protein
MSLRPVLNEILWIAVKNNTKANKKAQSYSATSNI